MAEEGLERLEERIAWLERHVTEQDKVTLSQSEELSKLREAILAMRERVNSREAPLDPNERPPHY